MAADGNFGTVEQIVNFLKENGGKVTNMDLVERFKRALPDEPERKAAARLQLKTCVNSVALVRQEDGVKYVCLRKKYAAERENGEMEASPSRRSAGVGARGAADGGAADGGAPVSGYGSDNQAKTKQPDEADGDGRSSSGSEGGASPRSGFLPQVRRSLALRGHGDSAWPDEDRPAATLDPLEHEWMLRASDGEWPGLRRLLSAEPGLVLRKDFITGFTCLHWAAKLGRPELLALVLNFAERNDLPLSVDVRSSAGYTPLHVAAMQGHLEVAKMLVGAYDADVEIRDHSGRRACQYLGDGVGQDVREILGAPPGGPRPADRSGPGFPKGFHSNLRVPGRPADAGVRPWEKPLRRKSSFTKMKPQLEKLRRRASQMVHSGRFREEEAAETAEGPAPGLLLRPRPKTQASG